MIKLLVLMGIFNGHPTFHYQSIPANYIQAGYEVSGDMVTKDQIHCLVSLKRRYKEDDDALYYVKNTCAEVQSKLRKYYESH